MDEKDCSKLSGWEAVKCVWGKYSSLWIVPFFILGITVGLPLGYIFGHNSHVDGETRFNLFEAMIPEILGIGISITGIYYLEQWRLNKSEERRLKEELLWQVKSQSNDVSISAIDRIRYKGWLAGEKGDLLKNSDLKSANLMKANLSDANLQETDLSDANLQEANLSSANLQSAILVRADLNKTSLGLVNLQNSDLAHADLQNAELFLANLQGSSLEGANLEGANLNGAKLQNVVFSGKIEGKFYTAILPDGSEWNSQTEMSRFTDSFHENFWSSSKTEVS